MFRSVSPRAPRSASTGGNSMVCVDCFQAKGENELRIPCQNPNCHFYLQAPGASKISIPPARRSTSFSEANFNPWSPFTGGYDQQQIDSNPPHFTMPATTHASSLWAYPASSMLSKNSIQKQRTQSVCFESEREKIKSGRYLRSRLMSLPMSEVLEQVETGDMIEDAFVSTPLFRGEEGKLQRLTPDTDKDSGTCSPYGILDWSDPHKTRLPTTVDCTVPDATCFDMGLLKAELCSTSGCKQPPSGSTGSPTATDPLRQFLLAGQFTSLLNCNDTYSRKVFVGGLPPDLDDEDIKSIFARFGSLSVDWPHKLHTKSCVPPRGYAFLLFKDESSVHKLLLSCSSENNKYFIYIPTNTMTKKKVQIRPWCLSDSLCIREPSENLDLRKAVFVGGVPRPLKAVELAQIMRDKYGSVVLVAIDCDADLKYPKGAACVVFSSHASYIAAVSARFVQLNYASMDKKIEIKPYVLEGQMCDECHGVQCNKKPAPFYCASLNCLQYYCEYCWATIHSMPGKQNHRPLQKDIRNKTPFC